MILFDTSNLENWPDEVYLGMTEISADINADFLSGIEQQTLSQLSNPTRKAEYLSGRKLLRQMIEQLGWTYSEFTSLKDELGKPSAKMDEEVLHISFSHSKNQMLCALSKSVNVGIDLEDTNRQVHENLAARITNEGELNLYPLLQLWTIKEAALKMKGIGIRLDLNSVLVGAGKNESQVRFSDDTFCEFCTFEHNNHYITLAFS